MPDVLVPTKARQHKDVKMLITTGTKRIGEVSKYDYSWGIGMGLEQPEVFESKGDNVKES